MRREKKHRISISHTHLTQQERRYEETTRKKKLWVGIWQRRLYMHVRRISYNFLLLLLKFFFFLFIFISFSFYSLYWHLLGADWMNKTKKKKIIISTENIYEECEFLWHASVKYSSFYMRKTTKYNFISNKKRKSVNEVCVENHENGEKKSENQRTPGNNWNVFVWLWKD